jgi:asparagine synthase (glutamine-hydrolysing)
MCGFFVVVSSKTLPDRALNQSLESLKRRGPDHQSIRCHQFQDKTIYFGHTRLAILDLSHNANQPFENDEYILVFNGEIYNHLSLRLKFCKNYKFQTTSDTETLIALFSLNSSDAFMDDVRGMFSFVLYNKISGEFFTYRDRAGEKPLYISSGVDFLCLTSDIAAARFYENFNKNISHHAVDAFLQHGNVPYPLSIYENSFKLPPASKLNIDINSYSLLPSKTFDSFLNSDGIKFDFWWEYSIPKSKNLNFLDAKNNVHQSLKNAVKSQLISDVPLGLFLSGGIDSSLIASIAAQEIPGIECFNIGFEFLEYDESAQAKEIANHLGVKFTSLNCTRKNAIEEIQSIQNAYSEPFSDSSQIPTMLISKLARSNATVVLTGDCGDELFGGYNRYLLAQKFSKYIFLLPSSLKKLISSIARMGNFHLLESIFKNFFPIEFSGNNNNRLYKALDKIEDINNDLDYYMSMITEWKSRDGIRDFKYSDKRYKKYFAKDYSSNILGFERMMAADFHSYMTDDILCKVDRASMHYSLETRVPFLDADVIDESLRLPSNFKIDNKLQTKYILKEILADYVPRNIFEKPKQGFGVPISQWMKKDLRDYTKEHCASSVNSSHGFFNQNSVDRILTEHLNGEANHEHKLWSIVQFNSWYLNQK